MFFPFEDKPAGLLQVSAAGRSGRLSQQIDVRTGYMFFLHVLFWIFLRNLEQLDI